MSWEDFLHRMAIAYGLSPEQSELLVLRLNDDYKNLKENQFYEIARQKLSLDKPAYDKRKQGIFAKFNQSRMNSDGCPNLDSKGPGKLEVLRQWLEEKYSSQLVVRQDKSFLPGAPEINWNFICSQMLRLRQLNSSKAGGKLNSPIEIYVPARLTKFWHEASTIDKNKIEQHYEHNEFLKKVIDEKNSNLAILGQPGTGKSSWLCQLAQYAIRSGKGYPIYISLSNVKGISLRNYLLYNWLENALGFIPDAKEITPTLIDELKSLFSSGKVWLLLDGVEKTPLEKHQSPLSTLACQLTGWIAEARIILSCRLSIWEFQPNILPGF